MKIREAVYKSVLNVLGFERAAHEIQDDHTLKELCLDELDRLDIIEDVEEAMGVDMFDLDTIVEKGDELTIGDMIKALEGQHNVEAA